MVKIEVSKTVDVGSTPTAPASSNYDEMLQDNTSSFFISNELKLL